MYLACEHPNILQHPHIVNHLMRAERLMINGKLYEVDKCLLYDDLQAYFNYYIPKTVSDVKQSYAITSDGEALPLYIEVYCNKCSVCNSRKINGIAQQFEFELLEEYPDCLNFFLTLTYRRMPALNSLNKKHIQMYMKRIRTWVSKNIGKEESKRIKFLYSGEYGKNGTKRPHWHVLILHFPYYKLPYLSPARRMKFFEYMWHYPFIKNFGRKYPKPIGYSDYDLDYSGNLTLQSCKFYNDYVIGHVDMQRIKNKNIGKYVSKYVAKHDTTQKLTKFQLKPYVRKSNHFGMNYVIKNVVPQIFDDRVLKNSFSYKNLSGVIKEDSHLCSYYLNKLLPTVSRIIPVDVRKTYNNLRDDFSILSWYNKHKKGFGNTFKTIIRKFDKLPKYIRLPFDCKKRDEEKFYKFSHMFPIRGVVQSIYKHLEFLEQFFSDNRLEIYRNYYIYRSKFFARSTFEEINVLDKIWSLKTQYYKLITSTKL